MAKSKHRKGQKKKSKKRTALKKATRTPYARKENILAALAAGMISMDYHKNN